MVLSRTKSIFWSLNYQVYEIPHQLTISGPTNYFLYSPDPQEFGLHTLPFYLKWRLQHNHTDLITVPCHALTSLCLRHPSHSTHTFFYKPIYSKTQVKSILSVSHHIWRRAIKLNVYAYSIKLSNVSWKLPILKKKKLHFTPLQIEFSIALK